MLDVSPLARSYTAVVDRFLPLEFCRRVCFPRRAMAVPLDRKDAGISEQWFTQFAFASGKFQLACYKEEIARDLCPGAKP
jgi:hypothetical protein